MDVSSYVQNGAVGIREIKTLDGYSAMCGLPRTVQIPSQSLGGLARRTNSIYVTSESKFLLAANIVSRVCVNVE